MMQPQLNAFVLSATLLAGPLSRPTDQPLGQSTH